mgnify:FL=1
MPPKNKQKKGLEITVQVGDLIKKKSPSPREEQGKQKKKKKPLGTKGGKGTPERTEKPGVPHGVDKKTQEGEQILNIAKGGSVSKFGMLSVKAGVDNNPNPTQADRIVGATKKFSKGGLAGRLAKRGYGKARK